MRIGHGVDVHKLVKGEDLVLGGVQIPSDLGLKGHSDADVLIHAIMDAMLGSLALGDIGKHFPDDDPRYHQIDSKVLLKKTYQLITSYGYQLINLDSTIMAEKPKLAPYIDEMRITISDVLDLYPSQIGIKATTFEKLGFVGSGQGIMAQAVVLMERLY
ncbi:2-C-methyl-D-erythritol 2,4-cyclodiphosphate synthase [Natranaerobius thermophilus]|uniref:2-C-methyl-D-erythritol 2,4-cyclodiphosphate synthase n=1 Tax=Natranaerobius thermophilus (strain ATCC BAA-1301 / DSM 18059 / JW/NM-WN-LF) TaxID=457570 RepID=ISPF_NATTJ|nr:2-C-methyl-D-erythritol 2,4-cyclodiphosphate synthase [Natranaerobius thermophilus]B2A4B2.1 RecName: Full=2-C-methyl-D-erythritol 2,4-cyclodiphosphate synthase; Short=MECDP-synthase; Short=MECPP-synthase; Short=MECPS [Natranaerobius thermophilus JW/NM-WN-LF]ACB83766.1 2-C-methyl-D-erythritol 2,4-cyclodiphosphate synthase [Natranaerobius thermophilus JW/NM-WN-LF]